MQSKIRRLYGSFAACLTFAVASVALAAAPPSDSTATKKPTDPPGTSKYMDRLRSLFDKWDLDKDNYLDKEELAKAFRGPDAKPYDYKKTNDSDKEASDASTASSKDDSKDSTSTKKPDYTKYPDYNFLMKLDKDDDSRISRDEFMEWARGYAVQLKDEAAQEKKMLALETKLQNATGKEVKTVEREIQREQAKIDKMNAAMNSADKVFQEHLRRK